MRYYKNVREGNTIIHETFATKKKKRRRRKRETRQKMISRRFKEKYLYREIYPKDERGRLKIATRDSSVLVLRANIGKTTFVDPQVLYLPKT